MELTTEQKYMIYRTVSLQFEKARIDKGWSTEMAAQEIDQPLKFLLRLEFGLDAIHKLRIGNLIHLASLYDKIVKIEFIDPPIEKNKN